MENGMEDKIKHIAEISNRIAVKCMDEGLGYMFVIDDHKNQAYMSRIAGISIYALIDVLRDELKRNPLLVTEMEEIARDILEAESLMCLDCKNNKPI